jgi:predicted N-acyltransferase
MTAPLTLRVHTAHDIAAIPPTQWASLRGSAFTEWPFLHALEASGALSPRAGWQPSHLIAQSASDGSDGGDLIAAAPMYIKGNSNGEFVFDHSWSDASHRLGAPYYPKAIIAAPLSPVTGPRALAAPHIDPSQAVDALGRAARDLAGSYGLSGVHWLFTTAGEAEALQRLGYQVRLGVQYHWLNRGYAAVDDWLSNFKSKRRVSIRRELREVAALPLSIEVWEDDQLDDAAMRLAFRLYRSTIDKKVWGRQYLNEAAFVAWGRAWRQRLLMVVAREGRGGDVVAGSFFVKEGDALFGRYWGCLREVPFLHFALSYYEPIRLCIARGWSRFEAGAQGEHKYERGFAPTLTYSAHHLSHPTLWRAVCQFLDQERAAVVEELVGMCEASPCRQVQAEAERVREAAARWVRG